MKAIVMSHENGGTYCIDSTGSFHFVKGYQDVEIGTEITIQAKKPSHIRKIFIACAAVLILVAIVGFTCSRFSVSFCFRTVEGNAAYYGFYMSGNSEQCLPHTHCSGSCRRY